MKRKRLFKFAAIAVVALCFLLAFAFDDGPTRKQRIERQFSPVTGEHLNLTERIKRGMNDAGSYENIKTEYLDNDSFLIVNQTYTGKNAFGGRVKGFVKAKIDTLGNVLEIIEQQ